MSIYIFSHVRTHTNTCTGSSDSKDSSFIAKDMGSIPGSRRSPEKGNGYPLQYSCLKNFMDREAWQAPVHVVERAGHDWGRLPLFHIDLLSCQDTHTPQTLSLTLQISSVAQVSLRFGKERAEWLHCHRRKDKCNWKKSFKNLELWMMHSKLLQKLRKSWSVLMNYISNF